MIRLVLFDIDGTLIASGGAGLEAFAAVARTTFGRVDGTAHLDFAGRTDRSIVREFFAGSGILPSERNFQRFFDDYVFWLDHFLTERSGRVLPGVREFVDGLKRLSEPPVRGLLTGNIRLGAELKLRRYGLWEEFELGAFSDDDEDRNRIAAIARDRGSARFGRTLAGEEILVIGDTPLDIVCARAIGARCLAVATGRTSREELAVHGPDWAVTSLEGVEPEDVCD